MTLHDTAIGTTGTPVAFIHGLFGQGKNFTSIAKALLPDARSLLVDLPDHGRSTWTTAVDYVAMADTIADHLRRGFAADAPVSVVGHSMGGKVAMVMALRHPELIERLVVVDISPTHRDGGGEFVHLLDSLAALDLATLERRSDADAALHSSIPDATVRGFLLQNLRHGPDGYAWQANLDVLRRDLSVIADFPTIDASFDKPTLWIAGERSAYIGPEDEPGMRRLFPSTRLVTIKGAGHWVHSERPETFVSALRVFLQL